MFTLLGYTVRCEKKSQRETAQGQNDHRSRPSIPTSDALLTMLTLYNSRRATISIFKVVKIIFIYEVLYLHFIITIYKLNYRYES